MATPTEDEVTAALRVAAIWKQDPDAIHPEAGRWHFLPRPDPYGYSDEKARTVTRMCLILDEPVTDIPRAEFFGKIVERLVAAEDRIAKLEHVVLAGDPRGESRRA